MPYVHLVTRGILLSRQDDVNASQSNTSGDSSTPEINGSSAGFLALVISLSVFVVLCCVAVFWLLAFHQPTQEERMKRKVDLDVARAEESRNVDPRSWKARIGRALGGKREWVQAPGEEVYESANDPWKGGQGLRGGVAYGERDAGRRMISQRDMGGELSQSSSTSTVELSVPSHDSPPTTPGPVYFPRYDEPFRGVVSPGPSILTPTSSYDEHLHDRRRSMAAEIIDDDGSVEDDGHFSVQSFDPNVGQVSMKKWDNGTKFRESIQ